MISMQALTIMQMIIIFLIYSFLTISVPAMVLGRKMQGRRLGERLVFYFMVGNFYIMNLVFVLQLLHISNRLTLILATVIPIVFFGVRINQLPVKKAIYNIVNNSRRLSGGQMGLRNAWLRLRLFLKALIGRLFSFLWKLFVSRWLEWLFIAGLMVAVVWIYGQQSMFRYGYGVSDLPVHNHWINGLSDNNIFIAGVYPFGFHCVIYYLHMITGIDTYVLLRLFGITQTFYIFMMLAAFLRLSCRTRYIPYAGAIAAVLFKGFTFGCYFRYATTLPQEFGMLFILPSIYFIFRFFSERRGEIQQHTKPQASRFCLIGFAMSFSMTLAVHFYDTMVAGFFCMAIVVGYLWWIFRPKYFGNIMVAGLISIAIAVAPMAIAYATGTPLQGSLGWGLNVIKGVDSETDDSELAASEPIETTELIEETEQIATTEQEETTEQIGSTENTELMEDSSLSQESTQQGDLLSQNDTPEKQSGVGRMIHFARFFYENSRQIMSRDILNSGYRWIVPLLFASVGICLGLGILFWILRRPMYGSRLVSTAVYFLILSTLLIASRLHIPALMNMARSMIYYAYSVPVLLVFIVDACCYLVRILVRWRKSMNILSLIASAILLTLLFREGWTKEPVFLPTLETNSAVTCLTNIIASEEDFTWTIVSANDERSMALDHGYHTELITFLRRMEYYNSSCKATIPTRTVFFFVEKIPVDYTLSYEGSGQSISLDGAYHMLPTNGGIIPYEGRNRWIVMSRFYYWAQYFNRLYPNELSVYYETDEFICYRLEQNPYRLYNLAIDYGFNSIDWFSKME